MNGERPITFEQAKAKFVHRFTMQHVPRWASRAAPNGKYYAPHFVTDLEWYNMTKFYGESELADKNFCHTTGQSWPLGKWLDKPFTMVQS